MIIKNLVFLFIILLHYCESYRILVCFPLYSNSLNILGNGIVRHLLNDGHEVTFITTHPNKKPLNENLREIDVSSNSVLFANSSWNLKYVMEHEITENEFGDLQQMGRENAKLTFENANVLKLLKDPNEHFDAVIADLLATEVYAGLAVLYNCPMIWLNSVGTDWQVIRLISDTGSPAYDTNYFGRNIQTNNLAQRIDELWGRIKWTFIKTFVTLPFEREVYEKTFKPLLAKKGKPLPDYDEIIYNASMIFGNEHNAVINRPSTPQNFKYIGGYHIQDPVEPLPKELQDLMDNASHGVIYFSMGSFWRSKSIPDRVTKALLKMFGELKQTVIWKYEDELNDLPKNVHTVRWAPQQSILAHNKCIMFITHGGMLSTIESVHFGVPIIGIPVLFDQFTNIKKAILHGYAINVQFNFELPKNLRTAINLMLSDDTYKNKAKELSSIHHDIPVKPGVTLVHWVRHVVRTKGALHLRSPALQVPLYQRLYLDLMALIKGAFVVLYLSVNMVTRRLKKSVLKKKKRN